MSTNQIKVGSVVDFNGSKLSVYGVVKSIDEGKITLAFREANHPKVCAKCGSSVSLSRDGVSGKIVCMRTGCGHEHGFKEWEEEHLISELTLAPKKFQSK